MVKNFIVLILTMFLFFSCTEVTTNVKSSGPTVEQTIKYEGPKARIAVANFKCKAAKCSGEIGSGIADMLTTALFQTGKFIVLERGEGLEAIQKELNLSSSGYVQKRKRIKKGLMESADILVVGAVTAFEPNASGMKGGVGGGPLKVPFLGGIFGKKKEAYIACDIRLIDVRTGRIINATKVTGKATSWGAGGAAGTIIGSVALGGGLGVYKNTPMEKAVRVMLENAVNEISKMVPESYFRYGENKTKVNQTKSTYKSFTNSFNVSVIRNIVNIRKGPGTNYPILTTAKKSTKLKVIGKNGNWYQIILPDGKIGWIYKSLVK